MPGVSCQEGRPKSATRQQLTGSVQLEAEVEELPEFEKQYSESGFWTKLARYARAAGRDVVERALLLYYVMQEEQTPAWAKTAILGALGYFITLIDAIPDITPAVGYADDLGVLAMAVATVTRYINDDVRARAQRKLAQWFGNDEAGPDEANCEPDPDPDDSHPL